MKKLFVVMCFLICSVFTITATTALSYEDEFNNQLIDPTWVERSGVDGSFSEANGTLKITSSNGGTFHASFDPAYLYQPVSGDFDIYIKVEASDIGDNAINYETTGIMFHLNDNNWVSCGLLSKESAATFYNRIDTVNQSSDATDLPSGTGMSPCWLRMKRVGSNFNCYYILSDPTVNENWVEIPPPSNEITSNADGYIGIYAKHFGGSQFVASFDYFRDWGDSISLSLPQALAADIAASVDYGQVYWIKTGESATFLWDHPSNFDPLLHEYKVRLFQAVPDKDLPYPHINKVLVANATTVSNTISFVIPRVGFYIVQGKTCYKDTSECEPDCCTMWIECTDPTHATVDGSPKGWWVYAIMDTPGPIIIE